MPKRPKLTRQDQRIAEAINELIDTPVNWFDDTPDIEPADIELFRKRFAEFLNLIEHRKHLVTAATVISSLVSRADQVELIDLPLPGLPKKASNKMFNAAKEEIRNKLGKKNGFGLDEQKLEEYLPEFWQLERELLRLVELNQAAIQTILTRLKEYEDKIRENCAQGKVVSGSKWERSLQGARSHAQRKISSRTRQQYDRFPIIVRMKDRVVGLATLWGNAVPFLCGAGLDTVGVISTVAGATAATVLPSTTR